MCEDSDEETNKSDIETRTWEKIQRNMTSFGFREGATKGKEAGLQDGFNVGYSDGLHLGKQIGLLKGILSTKKILGIPVKEEETKEREISNLTEETCLLCSQNENQNTTMKDYLDNFENIVLNQQTKISEITSTIEELNSCIDTR